MSEESIESKIHSVEEEGKEKKVETFDELGIETGSIIHDDKERTGKVLGITRNEEWAGGGNARVGITEKDGTYRVVDMSFQRFLDLQDTIASIEHPEKSKSDISESEKSSDALANRLMDMADEQLDAKSHSALSEAGAELANGNYDKSQRRLEAANNWNDELRTVVVEANDLYKKEEGIESMSFEQAVDEIQGFANSLRDQGDERDAVEIESIVHPLRQRPSMARPESLSDAIQYVEGILATRVSTDTKGQGAIKDLEMKRNIRDALFREKEQRGLNVTRRETRESEASPELSPQPGYEELFTPKFDTALDTKGNYSPTRGIAAIRKAFEEAYGNDHESILARLTSINEQHEATLKQSQADHPDKPEDSHRNFASKRTFSSLPEMEQEAIRKMINEKRDALGSFGENVAHEYSEQPFKDFVEYLSKQRKRLE